MHSSCIVSARKEDKKFGMKTEKKITLEAISKTFLINATHFMAYNKI
jgi:hypothetical protein